MVPCSISTLLIVFPGINLLTLLSALTRTEEFDESLSTPTKRKNNVSPLGSLI